MSGVDVLNVSVGLMSLVLGAFAIGLSVYFYTKAKDSEKESAKTLEGIKAQTEALQKLTGRWMDRLTRYATEPRPADEGLMMLVSSMASLPTTILSHLRVHSVSEPSVSNEALLSELVDCYIAIYYYTAIANVATQAVLPGPESFDSTIPEHANVQRLVDQTFNDFSFIARVLEQISESRRGASRYRNLLQEAQATWRPLVHTTESALASRRQQ